MSAEFGGSPNRIALVVPPSGKKPIPKPMKPIHRVKQWLAGASSFPACITRSTSTLAAGVAVVSAISVHGADIDWSAATATYNSAGNWTGGVIPGPVDNARVSNNGTVQVLPADPAWYLTQLRASSGSYAQSGSSVTTSGGMFLGTAAGMTGTYSLTSGKLNLFATSNIGEAGTGVFNLSGGTLVSRGGTLAVGNRGVGPNTTGIGTFNQTGGSLQTPNEVHVGVNGSNADLCGTYNLSNGSMHLGSWLMVGRSGGHGKFSMTGGAIHLSQGAGNLVVGSHNGVANSVGEFIQDAGTVNSGGELWVGQGGNVAGNNTSGEYTLNSGTLEVSNWIAVGREGGTGVMNINGGIVRKTGNGSFTLTGLGTVNQTAGLVDIQTGNLIVAEYNNATCTYTLGGTGEVRAAQTVIVQNNEGGNNGTFNLNTGGVLKTGRFWKASPNAGSVGSANFDGGTLVAIAHEPNFISGLSNAVILPGGLNIDSNGFAIGTPQNIDGGQGPLIKTGLGSLSLDTDAFLGQIDVDQGSLAVNGSISGFLGVNVADGAGLGGSGSIFDNINFGTSSGSYLLANSSAATPLTQATGGGTVTVANTRIDFANNDVAIGTPIPVLAYDNLDVSAGTFTLGRPGTVDTISTPNMVLVTLGATRNLTWTGSADSTWDIYDTMNWSSGVADKFGQGDSVTLGDPAGAAPISIVGPVRPAAIAVNNSNTITLLGGANGDLAGSVAITKAGTGKLVVGLDTTLNPNVVTPTPVPSTMTVNAGELQLGNGGTTGSLGRADIINNALLSFNYSGEKIIGNAINGTGSLIKNGGGNTILTGTVALGGTTTINSGRLTFLNPAVPAAGAITNNGELEIKNNGAVFTSNSVISGSGKLIKSGTGEVWLAAANTFTGDVEVSNGVNNSLNISHVQALGTIAGKTIVNGFDRTGGQFLNIRPLTGGTTLAEPIELRGNAFGRAGIRHEAAGQTLNLTGSITISSTGLGQVQFWNSDATSTLNIQGDITGTAMNGGAFFMRGSTGPINVTGSIVIADQGELAVTGDARVTLGAPGKIYQGFRTTIAVGHLRTLLDNTLPIDQPVHLGESAAVCKWLLGSGATPVLQTISGLSSTPGAATSGIVSGASVASTLTVNQGYDSRYNLPIGGTLTNENLLKLVKTGKGTLSLGGINTYTGTTTVSAGKLQINGETKSSAFTVQPGATIGGGGTCGPMTAIGAVGNTANVSPGDEGVGTLSVNGTGVLGPDSAVNWQVQDWNGVGDKILASTFLNITATTTNKVVIRVSQMPGLVNFSEVPKSFEIFKAGFSVGSFDVAKFQIDSSGFTAGTGTWSLRKPGALSVFLDYTPSAGGGNYASWATANGITGQPASGDFDKDNLTNLMEYGLGSNPTLPNGSPGTFVGNVLTFPRGSAAVTNGDVTWTIQTSTTLGAAPSPWVAVAANVTPTTISYTLPSSGPRNFGRLVVKQN